MNNEPIYTRKCLDDKQCKDCIHFSQYSYIQESCCELIGLELTYDGERSACVRYFKERGVASAEATKNPFKGFKMIVERKDDDA